MKRIRIFLLVFLLITSTVAAQDNMTATDENQIYDNREFKLHINLPSDWSIKMRSSNPGFLNVSAYSPTHFPVIHFIIGPHQTKQLPEPAPEKIIRNGALESKVKAGRTSLDGHEANWSLSVTTDHEYIDSYSLAYFVLTDHHDYLIILQGNPKNYEQDRKEFDEIIKTVSISQ